MLQHVKGQAPLVAILSIVTPCAFASAPASLPFGDGALVAVSAACVLGIVWLVRSKKK